MTTLTPNLERFSGLAETYDAYRPSPPLVLVEILTQLAQSERPQLVVDLGCGTGLSTRLWAERAEFVIGIEPNADMRHQAAALTNAANISYRDGIAAQTGLADGCADIVTVSQALHWMEPTATFTEVHRILRAGGVFAAYDYDWPPVMPWAAEVVYHQHLARLQVIDRARGHESQRDVQRWEKEEHLSRIQASGQFRHVREILLHQQEMGNAKRLIGLALSTGGVAALLRQGIREEEMGFAEFRRAATHILGDRLKPWYWSYRVRVGIK